MNYPIKKNRSLTPCAGRCSTVFGDDVCRGCRRYNHEIIEWNNYTSEEQAVIWQRLDNQIDQVLLPMLPNYDLDLIDEFLNNKKARLMPTASLGRRLYFALKLCEKNPEFTNESGLGIAPHEVKETWKIFEEKILKLGIASYELAWLRAESFSARERKLPMVEDKK